MLTIDDVCERLNCSPATAYRLVKIGALRATKNPGRNGMIRVTEEALQDYLTNHLVTTPDGEGQAA